MNKNNKPRQKKQEQLPPKKTDVTPIHKLNKADLIRLCKAQDAELQTLKNALARYRRKFKLLNDLKQKLMENTPINKTWYGLPRVNPDYIEFYAQLINALKSS